MISTAFFLTALIAGVLLIIIYNEEGSIETKTFIPMCAICFWLFLMGITAIFTGINIKNNKGQLKGYVTAIEKNGTFFVGGVYGKSKM